MRLTVGPLPPAVYWRRRAIVLGAGLVVLFLVAQACMSAAASPDSGDAGGPSPAATSSSTAPGTVPAAGRTPTPTATRAATADGEPESSGADPQPAESLDPAGEDTCTDQELLITAETGQESFPGGTSVQFTIRIQNDSDRSCGRDIGGDHRELYLRQGTGATKLWSSRDCAGPSGSDLRELAPAFETSYFIVWHGRSSGSCQGDEPAGEQVAPGDYQLIARLGTAYSEPVPVTVTG